MTLTRREFIRLVGITMAGVALTSCSKQAPSGDDAQGGLPTLTIPASTATPAPTKIADTPRLRVRAVWLRLDELLQISRQHDAKAEQLKGQLVADHQAALNELVAANELKPAVADQVQEAFLAAAYHIWRSYAATCYEAMAYPEYTPVSSDQLVKQSEILVEMAQKGKIDPTVVAQVQATIERDIAFLALTDQDTQALNEKIRQSTSQTNPVQEFDTVELQITPEAVEAAHFLVDLLLGRE
jgi:hypothetical protein